MENETILDNPFENVLMVILLNKNETFGERAPYDLEIMGKKMWEWVALAGNGANIKTITCTDNSDVLSLVKPYVKGEEITMVFYSDTPLLSRETILEILEYFKGKQLNVLKLKRGYIFNSEYLLSCDKVLSDENSLFESDEFEKVDCFTKLESTIDKIRNKILEFHLNNGVYIEDKKTTFIDADVIIEKGVKIEHNNTIKGTCYIGENCYLEPNNLIKDSILSDNVVVKSSYIVNSRIGENMIVGPFETIIDKNV